MAVPCHKKHFDMISIICCDAFKQNESELTNINLKMLPNKGDTFFVFAITQNAIS